MDSLSNQINKELENYIKNNIIPQYKKNEKAHREDHIHYVIRRSFELIKQNELEVNNDIVYVVAAYHDIGHHINSKIHEQISADIMYKDEKLKQFFSDKEREIIKEAIEDHRSSSNNEPRSIYGKIVSSADKNNTLEQCLERSYYYGKKLHPEYTEQELYERAYKHLNEKFGYNGYAKFYLKDEEYEKFLESIRELLNNKEEFYKIQEEHIRKIENRK